MSSLTAVLFAAVFAACLVLGWRLAGALPGRRLLILTAVALVPLLVRAFFRWYPDVEYELLSFDAWVRWRPWWAFAPAFLLMGIGSRRMSTRRRRLAVGGFTAGLFLVVVLQLAATAAFVSSGLAGFPDPLRRGLCRQTSGYSCGAAAAVTLLAQHRVPATEREMADLCRTNTLTGTDEFGVCLGLRLKLAGHDRRVRLVRADWEELVRLDVPAMATVRYGTFIDHWVVVLKADADGVLVADPLRRDLVRLSRHPFLENWRGVLVFAESRAGKSGSR